ncbi:hypothetical protein GCM10010492_24860 [Saccharothrix mutabilis subsp. mutabilis]|uniref:Uncharacterized protein n=1 Tax=Saccharothrix mutabilis subsp. mutabilis TaxID=66855 RepID=A0ABN0TMQ1_9PSEU
MTATSTVRGDRSSHAASTTSAPNAPTAMRFFTSRRRTARAPVAPLRPHRAGGGRARRGAARVAVGLGAVPGVVVVGFGAVPGVVVVGAVGHPAVRGHFSAP